MMSGAWLRSRPRVCGTTQKVQYFSHPSITVTKALRRPAAGGRAVILTSGPSPVSCTGRRSRRTRSTSSPTRAMAGEPKTRSTDGARRWIALWWSCAMQPITPMTRSGRCVLSRRSSPSFEKTLSSAFSRIAQVLTRMRSASVSSEVSSQRRSRSRPATRSESYSFIWQPYVIRWSLAIRVWKIPRLRWTDRSTHRRASQTNLAESLACARSSRRSSTGFAGATIEKSWTLRASGGGNRGERFSPPRCSIRFARQPRPGSTLGSPRRKWRGRRAPSIVGNRSVDLFGAAARPRGHGLLAAVGAMPVAVAEGERGLDLELALEAVAPLLPAFLVLELVLVQGRRLLDAVRMAELDGQLRRGATHLVPGGAQRELIRDGADPPCVDVAGQRDGRQDRARPVRSLRVDRHRQDVQVVAAAAVTGHHGGGGPR